MGRKGALCRISVENRIDISGGEDSLVVVTVEAVVGVSGAGHSAAADGGIGTVIVHRVVLRVGGVPARIVHDLGVVACTEVAVAVAAVIAVADAMVVVAAVIATVVYGLAFDVIAGVVVDAENLRLL